MLEELGRSAAGTAYKVRHPLLDSVLAVTVLSEELTADGGRLAHIQRAVRAAVQLRHDHIVPVLDFGRDDGRYYLVEAFASGKRLDVREHGPLPPADALNVARQLADALAHAHERGVIHGAITPACVLVEPGSPPRALLSGFVLGAEPRAASAPEVASDARSDVLALGLLLYEMLEGRPFFETRLRDDSTPLLPAFSRIVPSGVSALVARAVRHAPAQRQQSMAQLRHEIDRCLGRIVEKNGGNDGRVVAVVAQAAPRSGVPRRAPASPAPEATPLERKVVRVAFPVDDDDPAEPAVAQSAVARRILGSNGVRVGPRHVPVRGGVLAAAVFLLVGGWLVLRPAGIAPAVSGSTTALAHGEVPTGEPAVAAPAPSAVVATNEPLPDASPAEPPPLPEESSVFGPPPPVRIAPRIASSRPSGATVDVLEGAFVDFDVRATNGNGGDGMAYAWFLDSRPVSRRPGWRFSAPYGAAGTAHTVEVQVADAAGVKGPRVAWTVEVVPRMSEANVLDWLGRLTAALERKDVATLRLYGLVTDDAEGEALRKRVSRQKAARVSVGNESIETDGRYARVSFDLAEFDQRGQLLATRGESYELEKQATGFVGVRSR